MATSRQTLIVSFLIKRPPTVKLWLVLYLKMTTSSQIRQIFPKQITSTSQTLIGSLLKN